MTWGYPAAFYLAFVAIPIVAVFLYRRRLRVVDVPAVHIWEQLGNPVETRSFRSLLRKLLTLLVQILLLTLLIFALADPLPTKQAPQRSVIIIDTSYTMQTCERSGRRIEQAREKALVALENVPPDGEVVLIQAAHCPLLVQSLTRDIQAAKQKILDLDSLDVAGDLEGAVRLAGAFVDSTTRCNVKVISDFAAASPETLRDIWRFPSELEMVAVGEDQPDAAITGLWSDVVAGKTQIQATVCSYRMAGRKIPVTLQVNGRTAARQEVILKDSAVKVVFTETVAENDVLHVALESGDTLGVDDNAFCVAGTTQNIKICLVTAGNVPLERALRAGEGAKLRIVGPGDFAGPEENEVVVVDEAALSLSQPGKAAGYLFIAATDPFGCARARGWNDVQKITHWSCDHPCMVDIDPTVFRIPRALSIACSPPFTTKELTGAFAKPLIVEASGLRSSSPGSRPVRCLFWLFRIKDSDMPSHLSFPVLLWNVLDYLNCGKVAAGQNARLTGQPIQLQASRGKAPSAFNPRGEPLDVKAAGNEVIVSNTSRCGIYKFGGYLPGACAVNLFSNQALRPLPSAPAPAPPMNTPPGFLAGHWGQYGRFNWEPLLLACLIVGLVEWLLFHRRVLRL